jgi:hypothetical protein
MMRRFFEWVTAHTYLVVALSLILTAGFAYGLTKLRAEAAVENMLPTGYPSVEHAKMVDDVFEMDDSVVVAVVNEGPQGIYTPHTLQVIHDIADQLQKVRGVDASKVWSIFNVSNIVGEAGGFTVVPLCPEMPRTAAEIDALRERVRGNKMIHGTMVAASDKGTLIYGAVTPVAEKAKVYYDVRDMLAKIPTAGETFYITGNPVVTGVLAQHVEKDMSRMMPLVAVLVIVLLLIMFRTLRGLVLPLAGVIFCVIWSFGLMALCKVPIYPMTSMIPILLMAMGVAYGLHIIARYHVVYSEQVKINPEVTSRQVALLAMLELWSPLIMASTTDAAGFLSLLSSKMRPMFYTGVFTSFGLLVALAFALVLIPAALAKMKAPKARLTSRVGTWEDKLFERLGTTIYQQRKKIIATAALIFVLALIAARGVNVDSDPMSNFNQTDPIPISTTLINKMFNGAIVIHTTLESPTEKRFLDPAALKAVDEYQQAVLKLPLVGASTSVVDFLKLMHQAMNGGGQAYDVVPPTRNLIGTYLLLYSGENINHYINFNDSKIDIQTRVTTTSTKDLARVLAQMEKLSDQYLRGLSETKISIGGHGRVLVDLINIIVYGQIWSILLSMVMVFIITSVMFRSPMAGVFTAVPISLATAVNFGVMALLHIPLEPATAITACIGIGVGVDYGIHLIAKYQITLHRGYQGKALVELTMASAGKSIFFNAAVVIGGFLVLVISEFPPSRHMGFMVSLNMFTSYLFSVTVLPALLAWFNPAFLARHGSAVNE